jgi:hypothetical protein
MVLQSLFLSLFWVRLLSVGKKQLFYFFKRWIFVAGKNECAVCAVGFFSSKVDV